MKKVGTVTSAIGFIFVGTWLILRNIAFEFSGEIIKWWPLLIILFGVEIIVLHNGKKEENRVGFNFLIIPMIMVFIGINAFVVVESRLPKGFDIFKDGVGVVLNDAKFMENKKSIEVEKELSSFGNKFSFHTNNGDVVIKKSEDGKIKLKLKVYVDNNDKRNTYEIKEIKGKDGYEVAIEDSFIRGVEGEIYLPENLNVNIDINNLKFNSEEYKVLNNLEIDCNNASIYLGDAKNLTIKANNGLIQGKNSSIANINMNNGQIKFDGDVQEGKIKIDNGEVDINNKVCKNLNIEMNLGSAKVDTEDNNLEVSAKVNQGKIDINEDSRVNGNLSRKIGNGSGKLNIDVKVGSIDVETSGEW
ncbi:hypothetical protein GCM10008905_30250 [Clostridium malenominatum]|uniref:LiaI-LiaF-like transmembrane region domain-containing protein n=1 Tax=Clostridium malenominatum TaxID=1539 RepID=A0ABP3UFZ7_9CLOT